MGACLKAITELNVPQMYPESSIIGLLFFTKAIIFHKTVILANFKLFSKKKLPLSLKYDSKSVLKPIFSARFVPTSLKTSLSPHFGVPSEVGTSFTSVFAVESMYPPHSHLIQGTSKTKF